jgi:uncharacterized alpha-E superfamily protein
MSPVVLSRVAESIFWIGRYVERAEGTARILDVTVHHTLEEQGADQETAARRLLATMGLPSGSEPADLWAVTEALSFGAAGRSSIGGALGAARDNARAVRHVIPVELWEQINATWIALPGEWEAARRAGPAGYLSFVKTRTAAISGLADTTMSRDQTWTFFTLGRSLERADVVARLLASLPLDRMTQSGLVTLLRSCGGYEPYLRLAHGVVAMHPVVDFLLRDRRFPRSAFSALSLAGLCLEELCGDPDARWDEARGLVGLARAELEFAAPGVLLEQLPDRLARLQRTCSAVSEAVTRRFFTDETPLAWRQGESW